MVVNQFFRFTQIFPEFIRPDYMLRGKKIAEKHYTIFTNMLKDEDLPAAMTWEHEVSDSTDSPFSDKLMIFHIAALSGAGIAEYGLSLSTNTRTDIVTVYSRLIAESMQYSKNGLDIMIKNSWLEEILHTTKREELLIEYWIFHEKRFSKAKGGVTKLVIQFVTSPLHLLITNHFRGLFTTL